ncbi:MAG: RNB domain-containing ribonuclease [Deltaproteobacteria bacterium]|nr:RNB domain-containing ribonuclease [Deltaproteobacteria bacterium]
MNPIQVEVLTARVLAASDKDLVSPLFGKARAQPMRIIDLPLLPVGTIVSLEMDNDRRVIDAKVLAEPATAAAAFYEILEDLKIDPIYPAAVCSELEAMLAGDGGLKDVELEDLRDLPFVTIDNQDSRDLDQAICLRRAEGERSGYLLDYALADAAFYVRPGTALFEEARRRGVTYYLPGFSVPMLPPALSEGLISLNPRLDRRALVFRMRLDDKGQVLDTVLAQCLIHSRAKLTYDGVQAFYDRPAESPLSGQAYSDVLDLLREVGELRIGLARARNVVQFNRREIDIHTDPDGVRLAIRGHARNDCSMYNEQISLLCNTEGARLLLEHGKGPLVQPIFRVHDAPPPAARDHLQRILRRMIALHELDDALWSWRREEESLADYLDRLPKGAAYARLRHAIERQILLCNQRSMFKAEPGQHYALRVEAYSRFSSPMREIVGIFTHKEALEMLGLESPCLTAEEDEALREQIIQSANRAKRVQRDVEKRALKLAVDQLLRVDLLKDFEDRPVRKGTVLGLGRNRAYVELDSPPVELKIYLDDLAEELGERLLVDDDEVELRSSSGKLRLRVGDELMLRTSSYDEARGRWSLLPEQH